jgi:hypothetical protein
MKILLDTCILAELRHPNTELLRKALSPFDDEDLFISALTIGEIAKGISLLPESKKRHELSLWFNGLEQKFVDRILPIDHEVALMWGELTARARLKGITVPVSDGLIAATALCYGLHIMTRNVKHFKETGAFIVGLT